jgi:ABC-2 type transport system ATP-binding protein
MLEVLAPGTGAADTLRRLPGVVDAQVFGERIHVTLDEAGTSEERFMAALRDTPLAGVPVRQVPPSLEDVFIARLTGGPSLPPRGPGDTSRENARA